MLKENASRGETNLFLEEGHGFQFAQHPNVLKIVGMCTEGIPYLQIFEVCDFGDLKTYLQERKGEN